MRSTSRFSIAGKNEQASLLLKSAKENKVNQMH